MAIDTPYVLSYALYCVIEAVVVSICLAIYRNTKGASLAYKMWARGTSLLFLGCSFLLITGLVFECTDSVSTDKNEVNEIIGDTINAFGYFFLPLGAMYLSKDLGVGSVNEKLIKKSQIIFFSIISLISIFFMVLFPFFEILSVVGITFNFLYVFIWIFTIYLYNGVYQEILKDINRCWLFIYIGMVATLASEIFNIIYFIIPEAAYLMILSQLVGAVGFIGGFFKLAKMVEAI